MDSKVKDLFERHILPAHQNLSDSERAYFLHGKSTGDSYYEAPRHPSQLAYELMDLTTKEELEQKFGELWKDDPALLAMLKPMLERAFEMRDQQSAQSDDLNSFIYTLY